MAQKQEQQCRNPAQYQPELRQVYQRSGACFKTGSENLTIGTAATVKAMCHRCQRRPESNRKWPQGPAVFWQAYLILCHAFEKEKSRPWSAETGGILAIDDSCCSRNYNAFRAVGATNSAVTPSRSVANDPDNNHCFRRRNDAAETCAVLLRTARNHRRDCRVPFPSHYGSRMRMVVICHCTPGHSLPSAFSNQEST